ncbi:Ionotropic receptor 106 [Blattella germanica]|nr:Ionotropic receptor 106 [Blattella germanica]
MYSRWETVFWLLLPQFVSNRLIINDTQTQNREYLQIVIRVLELFQCINMRIEGQQQYEEILSSMLYENLTASMFIGQMPGLSSCNQYFIVVDKSEDLLLKTVLADITLVLLIHNRSCARSDEIKQIEVINGKLILVCAFENELYINEDLSGLKKLLNFSDIYEINFNGARKYDGKELLVTTFDCPLFSYGTEGDMNSSSSNIEKLDGIEMKIFLEVSKHLNFTWKLKEPMEINKWGSKLENGTWTGGIKGPLASATADVGFCCLWLTLPHFKDFDLTIPWDILCNTFLVPRPRRLSDVGAIFTPFQRALWCLLVAIIFATANMLIWLERISSLMGFRRTGQGLCKHIMDLLGILTLASFPPPSVVLQERRHVFASWTVFSLLMVTAYSSSLVSHLTVPLFEPALNSIRDLVLANIKWSGFTNFTSAKFLNTEDPWQSRFLQNFYIDPEAAKKHHHFQVKDHAAYGFILEGGIPFFLEGGVQMNQSAYPFLRVMKQCASRYYISLGLKKNSPYTSIFNKVIMHLLESGIVKHWKENVAYRHADKEITKLFADNLAMSENPGSLKLENLKGTFCVLLSGLILGTVVLIFENLAKKINTRNLNLTRE